MDDNIMSDYKAYVGLDVHKDTIVSWPLPCPADLTPNGAVRSLTDARLCSG